MAHADIGAVVTECLGTYEQVDGRTAEVACDVGVQHELTLVDVDAQAVEAANDVEGISRDAVDWTHSLALFMGQVEVAFDCRFFAQDGADSRVGVHPQYELEVGPRDVECVVDERIGLSHTHTHTLHSKKTDRRQ